MSFWSKPSSSFDEMEGNDDVVVVAAGGEEDRLSSLSIGQEKVLSLLVVFSATLSILGSSTIVYKVIRNRQSAGPYDRLLLALSCCDIVASFGYAMGPFLLPEDSSQRVWAIGTDATCTFHGWLTQFSFAAIVYNGMLSFYYLLTVRFGVKREVFAKRYEPWMHGCTLLFFIGTATMGAAIGLFNELELGFGCWANNYPDGCVDDSCTSRFFGWVIGAIPALLTLIALVVNNLVIYRFVRVKLRSTTATTTTQPVNNIVNEREIRQMTQIQEVASQGFLYVGSFFFCYTAAFMVRVLESLLYTYEDEADIFILLVLNSVMLPLQGFVNVFVYTRPNYARCRAAHPELGRMWAVWTACVDPEIPKWSSIQVSKISSQTRAKKKHTSDLPVVPEGDNESDSSSKGSSEDGWSGPEIHIAAKQPLNISMMSSEGCTHGSADSRQEHKPTTSDTLGIDDDSLEVLGASASSLRMVQMDGTVTAVSNDSSLQK